MANYCRGGCTNEHRQCTLNRVHRRHHWWGKNAQRYFHCPGRTVSAVRSR